MKFVVGMFVVLLAVPLGAEEILVPPPQLNCAAA
jgi:hypothetical protein